MLFKKFDKMVNGKEIETGIILDLNPADTKELDTLAQECGVMYVAAHGDEEAPDYLWGFNVYVDDEYFEEYETKYVFRPVSKMVFEIFYYDRFTDTETPSGIMIEVNPDTIDGDNFELCKQFGVDDISAYYDEDDELQFLVGYRNVWYPEDDESESVKTLVFRPIQA